MAFQDDMKEVHGFLQHTTQGNLKKMLVDGRFTDAHLNLLLKLVRSPQQQFVEMAERGEFPKMKFSNSEAAIKEKFWKDCFDTLMSRGLLSAGPAPVAAPAAKAA
ncbi:MAG TPA: hypothetical protein VFV50_08820 [Bdellovibrionales bacterium]|nr:hypothetical protein [Bdellovibrionales bacterium]